MYGHFQGKSVEFLVSCERFCLKIDKYGGWLEVGRAHWLCSPQAGWLIWFFTFQGLCRSHGHIANWPPPVHFLP